MRGSRSQRGLAPLRRRGFTLIEMLVAVAAVTLIILGVTRIFAATGETLRTGRSVSYMNTYAGLIEQQLREDIESMSRDGFLLIRHAAVDAPLTADTPAERRRVDELLFFVEGKFRSKRDPLAGGTALAEASEARVHYGHGGRIDPDVPNSGTVFIGAKPPIDDLGTGFNRFASDWILRRDVTLLAEPAGVDRDPVTVPGGGPVFGTDAEEDSDIQFALQPASAHIFRNLADQPVYPSHPVARRRTANPSRPNFFETGAIDIATTSLSEVRSIVMDAQNPTSAGHPVDFSADEPGIEFLAMPVDANTDGAFMQEWMVEALPADSDGNSGPPQRVRCELSPPDLLGLSSSLRGDQVFRDEVRSDQLMLSASNFVPHCTRFEVEWSFGQPQPGPGSAPRGSMTWFCGGNDDLRDRAYPKAQVANQSGTQPQYLSTEVKRRSGKRPMDHTFSEALIHGPNSGMLQQTPDRVYSFFGYVDPTYRPEADIFNAGGGRTYQPELGDVTSEPLSMAWPWPKLLRIKITLVDPSEPTVERNYEYVFKVPERNSVQ